MRCVFIFSHVILESNATVLVFDFAFLFFFYFIFFYLVVHVTVFFPNFGIYRFLCCAVKVFLKTSCTQRVQSLDKKKCNRYLTLPPFFFLSACILDFNATVLVFDFACFFLTFLSVVSLFFSPNLWHYSVSSLCSESFS